MAFVGSMSQPTQGGPLVLIALLVLGKCPEQGRLALHSSSCALMLLDVLCMAVRPQEVL